MRVGFIGLGTMGSRMAANIVAAGYQLVVHDLDPAAGEPLLEMGATWAISPAAVAGQVDILFTSLPGPAQVEQVALSPTGIIGGALPGLAYFDLSTNSPTVMRRIHGELTPRGVHVFDAPVSGGPDGAASGRLAIWVGGDPDAYAACLPVLQSFSDAPHLVGPIGAGSVAKLVHNCTGYILQTGLAETFTLGVKAGVDPDALWEAVRMGALGRRRTFDTLSRNFLPGRFDPPDFALELARKDVTLAVELAREYDVPMRLANLTLQEMTEAMNRGWARRDSRSAMLLQEERAGVEVRVPAERIAEIIAGDPGSARPPTTEDRPSWLDRALGRKPRPGPTATGGGPAAEAQPTTPTTADPADETWPSDDTDADDAHLTASPTGDAVPATERPPTAVVSVPPSILSDADADPALAEPFGRLETVEHLRPPSILDDLTPGPNGTAHHSGDSLDPLDPDTAAGASIDLLDPITAIDPSSAPNDEASLEDPAFDDTELDDTELDALALDDSVLDDTVADAAAAFADADPASLVGPALAADLAAADVTEAAGTGTGTDIGGTPFSARLAGTGLPVGRADTTEPHSADDWLGAFESAGSPLDDDTPATIPGLDDDVSASVTNAILRAQMSLAAVADALAGRPPSILAPDGTPTISSSPTAPAPSHDGPGDTLAGDALLSDPRVGDTLVSDPPVGDAADFGAANFVDTADLAPAVATASAGTAARQGGFFYGWVIVGAVFVILGITSGLGFYNASVILRAAHTELGASVGAVSGATATFFSVSGIIGFLLARRMELLDLRWFYVAGGLLGSAALYSLRWVHNVAALFAFFAVFGIGFALSGLVPSVTLLTRWFQVRRSIAISIASAGLSVGGLAITPIASVLISHRHLSGAGPVMALIWVLGVIPISLLLLRSYPADKGIGPDGSALGSAATLAATVNLPGAAYVVARRSRFFVLLCVAYALVFFSQVGGLAHLFSVASDRSGENTARFALSALALTSVIGRLLGGWIVTRIPTKVFSMALVVLQALALISISVAHAKWALVASAIFLGVSVGNLLMLQPLILAEAFGAAQISRIYGLNQLISTIGVAGGPVVLGLVRDSSNYTTAFVVAGLGSVLGFVAFLLAGPVGGAMALWDSSPAPVLPARLPPATGNLATMTAD